MVDNRILVCDDDKEIRQAIKQVLMDKGYDVVEAKDGQEAIDLVTNEIDLIVLDVMMPNKDGFETCREIRDKSYNMPILFLTARVSEYDKYVGFSSGGDDYLAKPFSMVELLARVSAILRRYQVYCGKEKAKSDKNLCFKDIAIDEKNTIVYKDGEEIRLTITEYKILKLFIEHPGKIFTIEDIYKKVWNEKYSVSVNNIVVVHINNLRKKLDETSANKYIKNIWGRGYCIQI